MRGRKARLPRRSNKLTRAPQRWRCRLNWLDRLTPRKPSRLIAKTRILTRPRIDDIRANPIITSRAQVRMDQIVARAAEDPVLTFAPTRNIRRLLSAQKVIAGPTAQHVPTPLPEELVCAQAADQVILARATVQIIVPPVAEQRIVT